jgi:hypothetical protein
MPRPTDDERGPRMEMDGFWMTNGLGCPLAAGKSAESPAATDATAGYPPVHFWCAVFRSGTS